MKVSVNPNVKPKVKLLKEDFVLVQGQKLSGNQKYGIKRNIMCSNGNRVCDIHNGIDIIGSNHDLLALADGKVLFATENDGTGCKTIVTAHGGILPCGFVLLVLYAHCDSFSKSPGDKIKQGEKVATMGATGNVTGVHLHCSMYAIPPKTWKKDNGTYYIWDYKTRNQYEIDPNELLKLY